MVKDVGYLATAQVEFSLSWGWTMVDQSAAIVCKGRMRLQQTLTQFLKIGSKRVLKMMGSRVVKFNLLSKVNTPT